MTAATALSQTPPIPLGQGYQAPGPIRPTHLTQPRQNPGWGCCLNFAFEGWLRLRLSGTVLLALFRCICPTEHLQTKCRCASWTGELIECLIDDINQSTSASAMEKLLSAIDRFDQPDPSLKNDSNALGMIHIASISLQRKSRQFNIAA